MGKQPYIPLYVGDWKKDTDNISLEAEGALLKLTFKMWDSVAKGSLSIRLSNFALMIKKSEETAIEIIKELAENNVLNISFGEENWIKFESRRMLDEVRKSLINSKNGSLGGRPSKNKNRIETELKPKLNRIPENENEDDIEDVSVKNGKRGSGKKPFAILSEIPKNWNHSQFLPEWADFMEMRRRKKWSCTESTLRRRIEQLVELSAGNLDSAIKIMQVSTERGYAEFFPLKNQPQQQSAFNFDKP